jgi:hypothetical protein
MMIICRHFWKHWLPDRNMRIVRMILIIKLEIIIKLYLNSLMARLISKP